MQKHVSGTTSLILCVCRQVVLNLAAAANRERLRCPVGVSSHTLNCLSDADAPREEETRRTGEGGRKAEGRLLFTTTEWSQNGRVDCASGCC